MLNHPQHPSLPPHIRHAILDAQQRATDPLVMFLYDLDSLHHRIRELMACLPPKVELYYAIKANSDKAILDTLAPWVDGFEISSGGEIDKVQACASRLPFIFSGPGKLDSELATALQADVEAIHVESIQEIKRLQVLAQQHQRIQSVFLRINPQLPSALESKLTMAGRATPFGIDEADLPEAIAVLEQSNHLRLKGFHVHAMSHQQSLEKHQTLMAFYLSRWPEWKAMTRTPDTVTHLNVGGGIGVNYLGDTQFDWPNFCQSLNQALDQLDDAPTIRFEPGRFITAFCGYYAMEVLDQKHSHGQSFLVCRGGTHQFRLPAAQSHDHPILHLPHHRVAHEQAASTPSKDTLWTVVGQLCTPKDVLSRNVLLPDVHIGDVLVLPFAGAYGYNISHVDFLCHPKPIITYLPVTSVIQQEVSHG